MGLINDIGRGISAGAYALSDFAGKAGLEQMKIDAEMERDKRLDEMRTSREQAAIASKRATDQADAATVKAGGEAIGTKRDVGNIEKARGLIGIPADQRAPISAEDVADIRGMVSPEFAKTQYGLEAPSEVQTSKDREAAAQNSGLINIAKDERAHGMELRKATNDENKGLRDDKRSELSATTEARKEKEGIARTENEGKRADAALRLAGAAEQRAAAAEARVASGGNLTEGERKTYTVLLGDISRNIKSARDSLKAIYDPAEKQAVQDQIDVLQKDHDTYAGLLSASQSGKGGKAEPNPAPADKGAPKDAGAQAMDDARRAVATGRISKDEANKRLKNAGYGGI